MNNFNLSYPEMTRALSNVTYKIVYECSWPMMYVDKLTDLDYELIRDNCNYWRNYWDIHDSWAEVMKIIDFYRKNVQTFVKYHGPGGWFDPDMLLIGNDGLSYEQSKAQMAFWCIWSAPLMMSNDLRDIKPEMKAILQNRAVLIGVNQDALGIMGHVIKYDRVKELDRERHVWVKKLSPQNPNGPHPYAVLYFNADIIGIPALMSYKLVDLIPEIANMTHKYEIRDLFEKSKVIQTLSVHDNLTLRVKTSGAVRMVKLVSLD